MAQVLGERMPGGQSAWTGGGLALRDPPGQRRFSVTARIDPKIAAAIAAIG
jgi:predicted oxidoreductase